MSTPGVHATVALALLLAVAPGCGAVKRVNECQAVIETVNSGLSELHLEVPDAGASASAYAHIADGYDALGKRLSELAPRDNTLAKAMDSYREVTDRAAKQSRAYSEALSTPAHGKRDRTDKNARLTRIRAQAQTDLAREAQAVRKLNAACHPQ